MRVEDLRAAVAANVLPEIPKLLLLLDRTAVSRTYGCFDRAYWHYRMTDFPCGMSQEFVLPLALVWAVPDIPGNPYFRDPAIRELVVAGIRYAARSSHPDGSCDDYYPFERAAGAAAFSLFAILEASALLDLGPDAEIDAFLLRRARWLAEHRESGRLSNHEALIVSCLERMRGRFPDAGLDAALRERVRRLLSWQDEEGWFDEYGGADLGYLSLTIGLLADLDRRRPDLNLRPPLARAIDFLARFVHQDGTVGGEYSSRSTLNFFPFGFEIAGAWHPRALAVNDSALRPLAERRVPCYSDDRILAHHLWGWLLTLREFREERPAEGLEPGRHWFPRASLLAERGHGGTMLACAPGRGGVYKAFADGRLLRSDTGVTLSTKREGRVAVCHLGGATAAVEPDRIRCEGRMSWAKATRLTPLKNAALRLLMLSAGRFFPDLVRRLLQRVLVTGRKDAPFRYVRTLSRGGDGVWTVRDEIHADAGWDDVALAGISGHQTSITTIMARVYQADQLVPFEDLTPRLLGLAPDAPLVVEHRLESETACAG
ncbi:hypothetical protein [Aureimonas leprariae]|uniref:Uncharacterized protein n=1 Tax=Plantimonas leprariae TaxID=2615207 RepID=A0A7V7TW94_9HYPH|nr:hypothetical protein [Aureimonas leprariae]KAB0679385.1 hypothetical protein F6X38_13715 [Aureimonas leprariae]